MELQLNNEKLKALIASDLFKAWINQNLLNESSIKDLENRIKMSPDVFSDINVFESQEERILLERVKLATNLDVVYNEMTAKQIIQKLGVEGLSAVRMGKALSKHEKTKKRFKQNIRHFRVIEISNELTRTVNKDSAVTKSDENTSLLAKFIKPAVLPFKKAFLLSVKDITDYLRLPKSERAWVETELNKLDIVKRDGMYFIESMIDMQEGRVFPSYEFMTKYKEKDKK